jgi:hypothetical protein
MIYKNKIEYIKYHKINVNNKDHTVEFSDSPSFWKKSKNWIALDMIETYSIGQGDGTKLLSEWLKTLNDTYVVLNVTPVLTKAFPPIESFGKWYWETTKRLERWYKAFGFKKVDGAYIKQIGKTMGI